MRLILKNIITLKTLKKIRERLVRKIISPIILSIKSLNKKSVFLDCGAYDGCSALKAATLYPFIDQIISFEADTRMWRKEASAVATLMPFAVWTENKEIEFQIIIKNKYGTNFAGAGSLINKKMEFNNVAHQKTKIIKTQAIDITEWILKNYSIKDNVILKLDIEGAEYPILKKLIEKEVYKLVNLLYIEWHPEYSPFSKRETKEITDLVYKKFQKVKFWDSMQYEKNTGVNN